MRAVQVTRLDGPGAVEVNDVPEPTADGPWGPLVLIDVHAVGVSFPDLLMTKGMYQLKPELPFTLGVDIAGVVREAPEGSDFHVGQRVASCAGLGGAAETVAVGPDSVLPLPDNVTFEQGAALPMNYLTAHFALKLRGALRAGETLLVNGAAGGVGTATIQLAHAYGIRTIGLVSSEEKAAMARAAGADEVVLAAGFRDAVRDLTDGRGVDAVLDVVGGALFLDSLRSLAPLGRLLVVGFTGGTIPEVKVNRLLLNNIDVRGVAWGEYAMSHPGFMAEQWRDLEPLLASGAITPPVGRIGDLAEFGDALVEMDQRQTLGKTVLRVR